ncbi:MAG: Kazal-type serine protease inhibitor family protein [Candidatus Woesearchaeota archaeon]
MNKYLMILALSFLVLGCQQISNYNECVAAGYPILESYPPQCRTPDGKTFTANAITIEETKCTEEEKAAEICTLDYTPVCGDDGITYGNKCQACASKQIDSYSPGECAQIIGGQRDEHGCLGPAGYSWDAEISACIRSWELDESQKAAAKIAVSPLSYRVTVVEVQTLRCVGCFEIKLQRNDNQAIMIVHLNNWEFTQCGECPQLSPPAPGWCEGGTAVAGEINACGCQGPPSCIRQLTEAQARAIAANSECTEKGSLTQTAFYNDNSHTWWIAMQMKPEFASDLCNPACVISEATSTAEINWRCTGLIN